MNGHRSGRPGGPVRPAPDIVDRLPPELAAAVVRDAAAIVRATGHHRAVRRGSSVLSAAELAVATAAILARRGVRVDKDSRGRRGRDYTRAMLEGMLSVLPSQLEVDDSAGATPASVLREIWMARFFSGPTAPARRPEAVGVRLVPEPASDLR
ncbi:MAG TPA: hypothetical protein VGP36_08760 [Mycobacteriales bacterium]|jgi:hypothetical protein|nr:hypothetical protein [Mycobacteriales bacterium]